MEEKINLFDSLNFKDDFNSQAIRGDIYYSLGYAEHTIASAAEWLKDEWRANKTYKGNLNTLRCILGISIEDLDD